ncbi:P-loop containing nucleoside triphosphate hydrolase protein [Armillaria novae-zelandiae]|uniref:P-loop containing nucleoside triphosphate hydrolase protein n=1 Tax=Armillaria novae-zelandiae TaxID=153914 RepID=A0AA39UHL2_9AGAR|nr:P-loop containing nucleoside triphosphate hydrolase protein [Armillaria novae-zelandiae]
MSVTTDSDFCGSTDDSGVGLADPGSELSQSRRRLLDLINRLHSTGAQVDIDLPQIAVIGSQSAGKSSLIESISGITLPRAAGTCTRCPTECRLSSSPDAWKCVVSLRFTKDANGQLLGTARNEQFGNIILDKAKVEERMRHAQRAILNPSRPSSDFLDMDEEDIYENELSFSTNCVSLQISGPGVADLSFCDLPGLIASVGSSGNEHDINLVKSLVETYISKPSCLILLTVACETDFENQGAHHLAKMHDADGKRTIGVLTKPDRIPQGEEQGWLDFIRNEKEPLDNNWYCVKQPSSTDIKRNITWAEARKRESEFFSLTAPWVDLEPIYHQYLGTNHLVERLSATLSDLISKRLPEIQLEIERSMHRTMQQLAQLPKELSSNPLQEISTVLSEFSKDVSRHIQGVPQEGGLLQRIHLAQEKFKRDIRDTGPEFRPYERKHDGQGYSRPSFLVKEEKEETKNEDEPRGARPRSTPSPIYVDDVRTRALHSRTRELPGHYPFDVPESYIVEFTDTWHISAQILCKAVYAILSDHVDKLIAQHLKSFGQNVLEQRARVIIQEHLRKQLEQAEAKIEWLVELESLPFTLNTHYLSDYTDKFLAHYKGLRQRQKHEPVSSALTKYTPQSPPPPGNTPKRSVLNNTPTSISEVLAGLSSIGIHVKASDLAKLLPPDEMEDAVKIMADVRGYFQVAYKRFADNVPLVVDHDLVRGFDKGLLGMLYEKLGILGENGKRMCSELTQENPLVVSRREELMKKLARLQSASEELMCS